MEQTLKESKASIYGTIPPSVRRFGSSLSKSTGIAKEFARSGRKLRDVWRLGDEVDELGDGSSGSE